jgi:ferric-dicitrate binding protein FerR (iron transport regulator)
MNKELLQRYVEGNVTTEEVETVVRWIESDESNRKEYKDLCRLYQLFLFNQPHLQQSLTSGKSRWAAIRKPMYELIKIAAIVLIVWGGMQWRHSVEEKNQASHYQTLFVPAGQRAELILPDSSKVWLNASTKISYPSQFEEGNRTITLDGEAYFEVTHDEKSPFVVRSKQMDIHVLGTEFGVMAYAKHPVSEVVLLKGSVELKPAHSQQTYIMRVNEQVKLKDNKLYVSQISDYDYFKWKEGIISFTNETVGNIFEKLQLYYDVRIEVENEHILNCRYSGKFRTKDGVEQVLKVLQLEQRFSYLKDNEQNVITIK